MSVTWEETVSRAKLDEHLSLGEHMEALWRGEDTDEHFDAICNLLWELHPSGMPDRVVVTLRNRGMEEAFANYVTENHRMLPSSHVEWPDMPRWWVIGPNW
jgi:hypothetical protein